MLCYIFLFGHTSLPTGKSISSNSQRGKPDEAFWILGAGYSRNTWHNFPSFNLTYLSNVIQLKTFSQGTIFQRTHEVQRSSPVTGKMQEEQSIWSLLSTWVSPELCKGRSHISMGKPERSKNWEEAIWIICYSFIRDKCEPMRLTFHYKITPCPFMGYA